MPQLSYSLNSDVAKYAGQSADNGAERVLTAQPLPSQSLLATITVANSTAYTFTFATTAGNVTATYTSDSSATKAEAVAGLAAAVNALAGADYSATTYGTDLVLVAKAGVEFPRDPTNTGAGTVTFASNTVTTPFGVFVAHDAGRASDGSALPVRLPSASTDKIVGLVKHSQFFESTYFPLTAVTTPSSPVGKALNCATQGRYWVKSEADVVAGDPVYTRYSANGGNTQLGAIRNADDSGHTTLVAGARFLSTGAAGTFVILEINLP